MMQQNETTQAQRPAPGEGSEDQPAALIFDRDEAHSARLAAALKTVGFKVSVTDDPERAEAGASLVFACLDMPTARLGRFLSSAVAQACIELVAMAEKDDPQRVRRAIAQGASYFFCKPFDPDFIIPLLKDVYAEDRSCRKDVPPQGAQTLDQFGLMRGSSPPMRKLYRIIRKVAPTSTSILLVGESGTGKELAARTLHQMSDVAAGPFVAMNCATIPKDLVESELFGHEKGSFSGADRQHRGFFERAEGGTLFLDELTELPLDSQVKLLRVLENNTYRRVGGEGLLDTDARIVAATNREPDEAIAEGLLREDLYYRIARFPIWLPPLRGRTTDLPGLAYYFLNELNAKHQLSISMAESALHKIRDYSWPGNVRELKSAMERAYILADSEITAAHLPDFTESQPAGQLRIAVGDSIADAERKLILATMEARNGDKKAAAEALGVSLKTLYNRLKQYSGGKDTERTDG